MDKWLGLLGPATALVGFVLTLLSTRLIRAKVEQISRGELAKLAAEWKSAAEDRDKLLVALREQQKVTRLEVEEAVSRARELDAECMQLTRERRATDVYQRLLIGLLKEHGIAVPPADR